MDTCGHVVTWPAAADETQSLASQIFISEGRSGREFDRSDKPRPSIAIDSPGHDAADVMPPLAARSAAVSGHTILILSRPSEPRAAMWARRLASRRLCVCLVQLHKFVSAANLRS
jgi:hypothetical protein